MIKWRWDQGRLDYFQFDEIKNISRALIDFHGKALPRRDDPDTLRVILEHFSERPFAPEHYKVWRNYKRVFGCQLLATEIGGVLYCTNLCRKIAKGELEVDDYLIHLARHFYFSSPVFDDYNITDSQVFPLCAIIKYLVSQYLTGAKAFVSLEEVIDFIKGNGVSGSEPLAHYSTLKATGLRIPSTDDELRQIREMLRFISQLHFLKWENPNIFLDVQSADEAVSIASIFEPIKLPRKVDAAQEILQLGSDAQQVLSFVVHDLPELNPFDKEFSEGSKLRAAHLKTERSGKLREFYYKHALDPHLCDMCAMDTLKRYPWADRVVELHHLLPLASPIRVEKKSSSLKDLVGLCPSCHRATHKFYSKWFRDNGVKDFRDYPEARNVYSLAKDNIVL